MRIRQLQETDKQLVADSIEDEFKGIINYGVMALIQEKIFGEKYV